MKKIPLVIFFTPTHEVFYLKHFKPSFDRYLVEDFELIKTTAEQQAAGNGVFFEKGWAENTRLKLVNLRDVMETRVEGELIVFSDVDIIFFENIRSNVESALTGEQLIAFQWDRTAHCTGFIILKNCEATRKLLADSIEDCTDDDQRAMNRQIKKTNFPLASLGEEYASTWRYTDFEKHPVWISIPRRKRPILFHANFALGKQRKQILLTIFRLAYGNSIQWLASIGLRLALAGVRIVARASRVSK